MILIFFTPSLWAEQFRVKEPNRLFLQRPDMHPDNWQDYACSTLTFSELFEIINDEEDKAFKINKTMSRNTKVISKKPKVAGRENRREEYSIKLLDTSLVKNIYEDDNDDDPASKDYVFGEFDLAEAQKFANKSALSCYFGLLANNKTYTKGGSKVVLELSPLQKKLLKSYNQKKKEMSNETYQCPGTHKNKSLSNKKTKLFKKIAKIDDKQIYFADIQHYLKIGGTGKQKFTLRAHCLNHGSTQRVGCLKATDIFFENKIKCLNNSTDWSFPIEEICNYQINPHEFSALTKSKYYALNKQQKKEYKTIIEKEREKLIRFVKNAQKKFGPTVKTQCQTIIQHFSNEMENRAYYKVDEKLKKQIHLDTRNTETHPGAN
ncbi:MAG: hypothetical protein HOO06_08095 [Bdellovibrionaceae bacterium]|jgi:hypothetical protein|nr:hypothetical protein [Pseudobdellovibrionaceae bacterium]